MNDTLSLVTEQLEKNNAILKTLESSLKSYDDTISKIQTNIENEVKKAQNVLPNEMYTRTLETLQYIKNITSNGAIAYGALNTLGKITGIPLVNFGITAAKYAYT